MGTLGKYFKNSRAYSFRILDRLIVPKAQHAKSLAFEDTCSCLVSIDMVWHRMLAAIDFNHQPMREAHEVQDVPAKGLLAAKFVAGQLTRTKQTPHNPFSVGHVAT